MDNHTRQVSHRTRRISRDVHIPYQRIEATPGIEVRRWLEGNHLMWQYHNVFTARLERVVD